MQTHLKFFTLKFSLITLIQKTTMFHILNNIKNNLKTSNKYLLKTNLLKGGNDYHIHTTKLLMMPFALTISGG